MNLPAASPQIFLKRYWFVFLLLGILLIGYHVRVLPARFNEIQGLDELHIYAMSEYVLNNNLGLPERDYMRHSPFGVDTLQVESLAPIYTPVLLYLLIFQFTGLSYYSFALIYPAVMGAIASIIMFFIGRELHNKYTGIFAALFTATIPAFITRTSAGEIEKEAVFAVSGLMALLFFIMAYKRGSWKHSALYSSLAGIFFIYSMMASAQIRFLMIIISLFAVILLLLNRPQKLMPSYMPAMAITVAGNFIIPNSPVNISIVIATASVMLFVALRYAAEKWNLIRKESLVYFSPALFFAAFIALIILSNFVQAAAEISHTAYELITLAQPSAIGYTVAENQPGSTGSMVQQAGAPFVGNAVPPFGPMAWASIWLFSIFGMAFAGYKLVKTRDLLWLFPLLWLAASAHAVLFQIRLLFLFGPVASLAAGLFAGTAARHLYSEPSGEGTKAVPSIWIIIAGAAGFGIGLVIQRLTEIPFVAAFFVGALMLLLHYIHISGRAARKISLLTLSIAAAFAALWSLAILNPFLAAGFAFASLALFLEFLPEGSKYRKIENMNTSEILYYTAAAGFFLISLFFSFQTPGLSLYTLNFWQTQLQFTILTITLLAISALLLLAQVFSKMRGINLRPRIMVIIIISAFLTLLNYGNSFAYSANIGPTICFTYDSRFLIDGQRCLDTDSSGRIIRYAQGQPWYDAMTFLRENTTEGSSVLSWWDFGYWFQVRGKRPSISDGGQGPRKEIADWFTADANNWTAFEPWLKEKYKVDYILMDFTLPGKYGAITAIETDGKSVQTAVELRENTSARYEQNGITVLEYCCLSGGQRPLSVLLFVQGNNMVLPPAIVFTGSSQTLGVIDELCTQQGIVNFQNVTGDIGGCIALTDFGIFYLPEPMQKTIFSRLMFMDGFGLPVKKEYDNKSPARIIIYKML